MKWARVVVDLSGGKHVTVYNANLVEEAISLTNAEFEDWVYEILEWEPVGRLVFGDYVHEARLGEVLYAHPECYDAQLDALVLEW